MHESGLDEVLEAVGVIIGESDIAAGLREAAMVKRFELFAAKDELEAIRTDMSALIEQRAAAERGSTASALVELDERVQTRFAERFTDLDLQARALADRVETHQHDIDALRARLGEDVQAAIAAADGAKAAAAAIEDGIGSRVDSLDAQAKALDEGITAARADLADIKATAEAASENANDAMLSVEREAISIEKRISEKFELAQRERSVAMREAVLEVAAPRQQVDALAGDVTKLVERFEDALLTMSAEGMRIEAATTERVMMTVREIGVSLAERFETLRLSIKDGEPGAPGPQGERGLGVVHRGTYAAGEVYAINDEVMSKGSTWRALVDNPGELPGPGWQLAAQRGKQGERGLPGERGPAGPAGPAPQVRFIVEITMGAAGVATTYSDGKVDVVPYPAQMLAAMAEFEVVS